MKFLKLYSEYILEKAVSADEVLVKPEMGLVLYERTTSTQNFITLTLYDFKNSNVEGYVKLNKFKSDKFYNLYQIFAKDKHGPLMYELAMSSISPEGIIPSRKIRKRSIKVWEKFNDNNNIIKTKLDPENEWYATSFDYGSDETNIKDEKILDLLNQVYSLKNPIKEFDSLLKKGDDLVKNQNIKNSILSSEAEKEFKYIYNSED